eukprot:TRINITY_DN11624_c0_g1_i3.p1 TRINITY_DN11624_c0_g1~~TRINITY_DN11624_c0_g1_i3.p1  ORF type:complete len:261 (-),score=52.71 TRINITY_DN11624_c0_g1_i3:155-937(-)
MRVRRLCAGRGYVAVPLVFGIVVAAERGRHEKTLPHPDQETLTQPERQVRTLSAEQEQELREEMEDAEQQEFAGEDDWDDRVRSLREAGWADAEIDQARNETILEAKDEEFLLKLLRHTVYDGIKCCAKFNKHFKSFTRPSEPLDYVVKHGNALLLGKQVKKRAIFILGPSSAGKTSIAATAPDFGLNVNFPAMTIDGADWRDVSAVWQRYAVSEMRPSGAARNHTLPAKETVLSDYYNKVYSLVKQEHEERMMHWVSLY